MVSFVPHLLLDDISHDPASSGDSDRVYTRVAALERDGLAFVLVVLVDALGSTPQDAGAKMIVTSTGRLTGTIGGGRVETQAIAVAQEMLGRAAEGDVATRFVNWSLKGDVGMTCGGSVKLYFEPHPAAVAAWPIMIFGAGHIAQALVRVLLPLPCSITVCDARPEWLEQLPRAPNLRAVPHDAPAALVDELPRHAFLLCMTKGHSTDRPILRRALELGYFPFVGAIGSDAKAAILKRELVAEGLAPEKAQMFHCPLGLDFGSNHPHEIALSIAAQLVSERDRILALNRKQ